MVDIGVLKELHGTMTALVATKTEPIL